MEIIAYGAQPAIEISIVSESYRELRNLLFELDELSRLKGYLTIGNVYARMGVTIPTIAYHSYGWNGYTCFGNGPIGEKKRVHDGVKVYYYDFAITTDLTKEVGKVAPEFEPFKPALPKAAKDAKIQKAYNALTRVYCKDNADDSEIAYALQEAIGYLGEVLE